MTKSANYAIAYIALSLLLFTLIPFDFKWMVASRGLKWTVEFQDVVQNLYLFFPLGLAIANKEGGKWLPKALLYGALLSFTIEVIQMSDRGRSSNWCDVLTNAIGSGLGGWYFSLFLRGRVDSCRVALVAALMPLVWFISMRAVTQPLIALVAIPLSLIAVNLLALKVYPIQLKILAVLGWLAFALVPLLYMTRKIQWIGPIGPGPIVLAVVAGLGLFRCQSLMGRRLLPLLCLCSIIVLVVDIQWAIRRPPGLAWTAVAHLHWIDALMSLLLLPLARRKGN